ncbi:DUF3987 domain-containing protein [Streptomyces luteireticuli]|uniref:DUF3987 domain-containing protein n=1 Tax=Streptomyces luteireticuli TaxID=173858 RepID=A0ABP3ILI7_9ACTN
MSTDPDFRPMATGRLRQIVEDLEPHVEWTPIGILGSLLSVFSAMLPETRVQLKSGSMPLMLHALLCGDTGEGKGQSYGCAVSIAKDANAAFMASHTIKGVVGGAGLIQRIADRGGHALIVDSEYARILRAGKRQTGNLSQTLRDLWDGETVATNRAKDPVQVDDPRVSMVGQITPAELRNSMSATDRDGGSYNRLLILPVKQIRWLSERHKVPAHLIPEAGEIMAGAVRHGQRTKLVTLADEAYDTADTIRRDLATHARSSELLKAFAARCNEQARRIAALYALFDLRTEITVADLEAAAALVRYGMDTVEEIVGDSDAPGAPRQPRSLLEKTRARIELFGGMATSSQLLGYVGATAEQVRALPEMKVVEVREAATGRAAVYYVFSDEIAEKLRQKAAERAPKQPRRPAQQPARRAATPQKKPVRQQPARPAAPAPSKSPFFAAL